MTLDDLRNKKVVIVGMGVNNRGLAAYLRGQGVEFDIVKDWKSADELVGKLDNYDVIFRTPGLPYLSRAVQQAKEKGALIYSQTRLFFDLCPAKIVGVTGTKGKGTTATLIYEILKAAQKKIWLSGNIGQDPFAFLDQVGTKDLVVLELSSFQLQDLRKSPHVAVVLKITADHLDHHSNIEEYVEAKRNIVAHQSASDFAVLNYDSPVTRGFADFTKAAVYWNSTTQPVSPGCFISNQQVLLAPNVSVLPTAEVGLIGGFNLENITAAVAAAAALDITDSWLLKKTIAEFHGLPHRLEYIGQIDGARYYDDSFSTVPDTTIAALEAFTGPIILIAGGSEKRSDYSALGTKIAQCRVKALIPIGLTGPQIAREARKAGFAGQLVEDKLLNMKQIVAAALNLAAPGDVVLLSPAAASFDMFLDYKQRGEQFREQVLSHDGKK